MCDPCCYPSCGGCCEPPGYPYCCAPRCGPILRESKRNPTPLPKIPKKNYICCCLPVGKAWLRKNSQRCCYGCPCKAHCYISPPGMRAQTQYCRQSVCCPPCYST